MAVIDRIKQFIGERGVSKREFYSRCGIANGYLDKVKDIGVEKLERIISAYPEINLYWLILGQGSMLVEHSNELHDGTDGRISQETLVELNSRLVEAQSKIISLQDKIIRLQEGTFSKEKTCK